jgi:hypothetical protein
MTAREIALRPEHVQRLFVEVALNL